ncbi:MAG: MBOAT family protein [Fimbriimonadaceae bacterium]
MSAMVLLPWLPILAGAAGLPVLIAGKAARRLAQVSLVAAAIAVLALQSDTSPAWRLVASSVLFLYVMKGVVLLAKPRAAVRETRLIAYALFFTAWPGMAIEGLQRRRPAQPEDVRYFGRGLLLLYLGAALVIADAVFHRQLNQYVAGWICLIGLLLGIHFGISEVLTAVVRYCGWPVDPLFRSPEQSRTLEEFWGQRWNLPFVEMDRRLFVRPLVRLLGPAGATAAIFGISGVFHEMALSYPAGGGWGLPLAYFALQAAGTWLQSRGKVRTRLWTIAIILLPLPLLFHPAFIVRLPFALVLWLHVVIRAHAAPWYLSMLLWVLGAAQLLPLAASFQVPQRLNWKEELSKLSPFNHKLMWTYGAFVVLTIVAFAVLTLVLHNELLRGDRAARAFATFAAIYWGLRLLADTFYLKADEWPQGAEFVLGHGLLNSLFAFLALGYGAVAIFA